LIRERQEAAVLDVTFPSWSPFVLADMQDPGTKAKQVQGRGLLYVPEGAAGRLPAVVVIEGAGRLDRPDRSAYGEKLRAQGFVALALDSAAFRGGWITESMQLADAYAALRYLAVHPLVDSASISVLGFGQGGMVAVLAAYQQIRRLFGDDDLRFAGHVSCYGYSLPRLANVAATGAPVLILIGARDRNVSIDRSRHIAADLTRGGALVEVQILPQGHHAWASQTTGRRIRHFSRARCRIGIDLGNAMRDENTGLPIRGRVSRALARLSCLGWSGYHVLPDEAVTRDADEAAWSFLESVSTALPARPAEPAPRQA
jgi:dienelactone hydrolase